MRRRSFLAAIAAAFTAPDPEKLLWQPGKKLISLPSTVIAPEPVLFVARMMDVTTHSSTWPWREYLVTGYDVVFEDGKVLSSFGDTPPSRREAQFQYRSTFAPRHAGALTT